MRRQRGCERTSETSAGHTNNVPTMMPLSSLRQTSDDWPVEPRSLETGILTARSLIRGEGCRSAVQVMSIGASESALCHEEFICEAEHVMTVDNEERIPEAQEEENFCWRRAATMATSRWQSTTLLRNRIWFSRQQPRDLNVTVERCTLIG